MSHIADVVLLTFLYDEGMNDVNAWLKANDWPELVEISDHAGGNRSMQCDVWAAAINYFDIEEFAEAVSASKWEYPESVQLFVKDEHDDNFTLRAGVSAKRECKRLEQ